MAENHIFDIPGPTPSSIGEVAYCPLKASEGRKKNIYPQVLEDTKDLLGLVSRFHGYPFDEETTRYSTRIFTTTTALNELEPVDKTFIEPYIEGIIPLAGCQSPQFEDCVIIYLGKNTPERTPPANIIEDELFRARKIFERPDLEYHRVLAPDFSIRVLTAEDRANPDIQMQYAQLYKAFGYTLDDVAEMLLNPNNIMMALFDGETIISTGMVEHACLNLIRNGQPVSFHIGEVTEGFTREETNGKIYRGKGLYTHLVTELLKHEAQTGINLIYAESNADMSIPQALPPVLVSAQRQGRQSTITVCEQYGFKPGLLRRHVHITNDGADNRPATVQNDLLVTYMPRKVLLERYGK